MLVSSTYIDEDIEVVSHGINEYYGGIGMTGILSGKSVSKDIRERIRGKVSDLEKINKYPTLGIIRLGKNPGDISYEKSILKNCDTLGIKTKVVELDSEISTDDLTEEIDLLNGDDLISGILLFRPLPSHIDEELIRSKINVDKDVDCMHPLNLEKIFEGDITGFAPCTPKAAVEILSYYDIPLEGKNIAIINRSMVVGKPLAMMLLEKNATVTICHSRTKNLDSVTRDADIVITALGKAKFFDRKYFNENSIVIDVGVSLDDRGKVSGDVDFEDVQDFVNMVTPVPGGVGAVTTSILLSQVVYACK